MTTKQDKLDPKTKKYVNPFAQGAPDDAQMKEKLKKTFGGDLIEQLTAKLPGMGPKTMPYGYTSEEELRTRVAEIIQRPPRRLSQRQIAAVGIELDPMLQKTFAAAQKKELTDEEKQQLGERWLERLVTAAKKRGRLMTDQQLADWRLGRKLCQGDAARYLGPTRTEETQAQLLVPREHGQVGFIINVHETREARIITFHPKDAVQPLEAPGVDKQFVDLQVREHTAGWLQLERIPE
jgi:hypothetical protein